jgi:signal transduction histidine kinase
MSDFSASLASTWRQASRVAVRLFHEYANWLVGITWKRFAVFALLLLVLSAMLQKLPPFNFSWDEVVADTPRRSVPKLPAIPAVPEVPAVPSAKVPEVRIEATGKGGDNETVVISIDKNGVRIGPKTVAPMASSASSASANAPAIAASDVASASASAAAPASDGGSVEIALPNATREAIREAVRAAREAAKEAAREARQQAEEARQEAQQALEEARRDALEAVAEAQQSQRTRVVRLGDSLPDLAFFWIVASGLLKITYKGRVQADARAAVATETAESEQLKRQVVEARMAAMQAQVEPHFLFNTLASIDHLIETDPPRASQMQKNLIALLRASMPTMRESHPAAHNLGREMAVIRPYLEILKVRMEDRLQTQIEVPEGLLSADFPSMMIQSLVENAIKHGLEPKPEGGRLTVRAEIVHGKLAVTVADTGLGFGKAATAGTGIGLNNIRERLQLLYGTKASMTVAENSPSGTKVTLTVPYQAQTREGETA